MLIRQTITEALQGATVPASLPAMAESADSTENDAVMLDFLDSFL